LPAGRVDAEAAQEALLRDRRRAATYLVAVCALVGRPGLAREWAPWALDAPVLPAAGWGSADGAPEPAPARTTSTRAAAGDPAPDEVLVTGAERALWPAAAARAPGDGGAADVRRALRQRVALLDDDARARWRTRLLEAAPALPGGGADWGTPADDARGRRRAAAPDTLPLLRSWAAWSRAVVDGEIVAPAAEPRPLLLGAAGPASGATAAPGGDEDAEAPGEALLRVVGSLVDEGAPVARDLLQRAEVLGERGGRAPAADRPGRAAFVAPLVADDLRDASHARAAQLAAAPAPSRALRLGGRTVTVTPTDDAAAPAATARAELLARPVEGPSWGVVGAAGAAAVVALVLGIVAGPAWFVVTVVAGVVAAWQWFAGEQRGRDQRMQAQQRAEQFDADLAA